MNRAIHHLWNALGLTLAIALVGLSGLCVLGNDSWNLDPRFSLIPIPFLIAWCGITWWFSRARTQNSAELVPAYFQSALDGLKEGMIIVDDKGQIAFANQKFLEVSGATLDELLGQRLRNLTWRWKDADSKSDDENDISWLEAIKSGRQRCGRIIGLPTGASHTFVMNAVPLSNHHKRPRGAMVSLEDISQLQKKQSELTSILETVRQSAQQIRHQNSQLEQLVMHDPLTGCLNRRSGLESLERCCAEALRYEDDFSCLMLDVDHFRSINDQHGHQLADRVLREVGMCLQRFVRDCDIVCRFEGEAFLILLPRTNLTDAGLMAERLRLDVSRLRVDDITLTASLGVAALSSSLATPQSLLAHADACLSQAKSLGRNQVFQEPVIDTRPDPGEMVSLEFRQEISRTIPFPAVTALISALAYRDSSTASHSRRVADLCVTMGHGLMSMSNCYVLEIAALLHDIGKIGVPDATLLKPTPLSPEEWEEMRAHERIGVEIVRTSFGSPELTEILQYYTRPYGESLRHNDSLPLGARILAVADAYDSMTTDQIYRKAVSPAEAIAELRRCAGSQFDPEIVSQFIERIFTHARGASPSMNVAREAALAFGLEIERLAEAVDQQDLEMLSALAGHLGQTAIKNGAAEIGAKAMELNQMLTTETDLLGILRCAEELLSYCRSTQAIYATPVSTSSAEISHIKSLNLSIAQIA